MTTEMQTRKVLSTAAVEKIIVKVLKENKIKEAELISTLYSPSKKKRQRKEEILRIDYFFTFMTTCFPVPEQNS